jgi:hypothetical protein
MMTLVRTIPHDPVVAVSDTDGKVAVVRSSDWTSVASWRPFDGRGEVPSTAVGDVDGDTVPDVAVMSGAGIDAQVRVYSGGSDYHDVLHQFEPFDDERGGSIALGDLNGDNRDDIVVGAGADGEPTVKIFDGDTGDELSAFEAYGDEVTGGVSVAVGMVEAGGRQSLVTGSGGGGAPEIKLWNFDLFGDDEGNMPDIRSELEPIEVAAWEGAPEGYEGGVAVATGWPNARAGGFATILVTTTDGPARLSEFSVADHAHDDSDVAVSGVARPHAYDPSAPRTATLIRSHDLGYGSGAYLAAVSTPTGALYAVVPADGGPVTILDPLGAGSLPGVRKPRTWRG